MPLPPSIVSRSRVLSTLVACAAACVAACSRGDSASVTTAHAEGESARTGLHPALDVPSPTIAANSVAYTVAPVSNGGTVAGTVEIDGAPPADSTITPPAEVQKQCGTTLALHTVDAQGTHLGGAVVWLEGVRRGKAPPSLGRHEVSIDGCVLVPRVQAVMAGGTLNVHSEDRLQSLVRAYRWPSGETAATVTTNDDGEVVPNDRVLSKVGLVELRGAQPPWLRAWVLVFDHPYVATSGNTGSFSLDSVPPGQYKLVAWHERFGRVEQPVTVTAGQTTTVTIHMHAPNGAAVAAADSARGAVDTARSRQRGR